MSQHDVKRRVQASVMEGGRNVVVVSSRAFSMLGGERGQCHQAYKAIIHTTAAWTGRPVDRRILCLEVLAGIGGGAALNTQCDDCASFWV